MPLVKILVNIFLKKHESKKKGRSKDPKCKYHYKLEKQLNIASYYGIFWYYFFTTPRSSAWVIFSLTVSVDVMLDSGDEGIVLFFREIGADRDHDGEGDRRRYIAYNT